MKLCEHDDYTVVTKVKEPRYHDKSILIDTDVVNKAEPILVIRFAKESAFKEYGWFVMKKEDIQKSKIQKNGRITVYCAPLSKREEFIGIKYCKHLQEELIK